MTEVRQAIKITTTTTAKISKNENGTLLSLIFLILAIVGQMAPFLV
jgi:hypothetical protein